MPAHSKSRRRPRRTRWLAGGHLFSIGLAKECVDFIAAKSREDETQNKCQLSADCHK